jgi:hypothetical protein
LQGSISYLYDGRFDVWFPFSSQSVSPQEPTSRLFSPPADPVSFTGQILRNTHGKRSAYELSEAPSLTIYAVIHITYLDLRDRMHDGN